MAPRASPHSRAASVYRQGYLAVMAAVIPRPDTFSSGKALAPGRTVRHEPLFSPTAAPLSGTINLSPTRKDTTNRYWQRPLVTDVWREDGPRVLGSGGL